MLGLLVVDLAKKLETGLDLEFWLVSLDDGGDDGDVDILGADVVRRRDHRNVDVCHKSLACVQQRREFEVADHSSC